MSYLVEEHREGDRRCKEVVGVSTCEEAQCCVDSSNRHTNMPHTSSHKAFRCQTAVLLSAVVLLICTLETTMANPIEEWPNRSTSKTTRQLTIVNECGPRGNVRIEALCQRCAKSTKSDIVYPMCCEDREAARTWCERYTSFGIQ